MSGTLVDYSILAFEAVERFDALKTPADVMAHMNSVLAKFGYTGFMITSTPNVSAAGDRQTFLDGWPGRFNDYYVEQNFYKDDPIAAYCRQTFNAFEWKDVRIDKAANRRAEIVMGAASEVGLRQGFSIPVFQNCEVIDAITMAGEKPDFDPLAKRALALIGLYAHAKTMSLIAKVRHEIPKVLSTAEREAMTWVALGKTSGEIAIILGVSESAVVKRTDSAMKKLDAVTRAQATASALVRREIRL